MAHMSVKSAMGLASPPALMLFQVKKNIRFSVISEINIAQYGVSLKTMRKKSKTTSQMYYVFCIKSIV